MAEANEFLAILREFVKSGKQIPPEACDHPQQVVQLNKKLEEAITRKVKDQDLRWKLIYTLRFASFTMLTQASTIRERDAKIASLLSDLSLKTSLQKPATKTRAKKQVRRAQ